jgi:membrane-bound serine protease (ClpP class)
LRLVSAIALVLSGAALFALHLGLEAGAQERERNRAVVLEIDGPIGPAVADYFEEELGEASLNGAQFVIAEMDTPGGLDDSMRQMIQAITRSDIPVITYVSPSGARAASAGLYIMYGSHIAAMAPGTNTGAATPVQLGGGAPTPSDNPFPMPSAPDLTEDPAAEDSNSSGEAGSEADATEQAAPEEVADSAPLSNNDALRAKVINDSSAYIRALAKLRGRNAEWAEMAVREAASISAEEALEIGVIDIVADNLNDLLTQLDGRVVVIDGEEITLETGGVVLDRVEPGLLTQILAFVSNPNVAIIFMTLGVYGIIIEMWNPGSLFPGALGVTCLIIGFYSLQVLPVNWLGFALMGVGALLIVLEAFASTFGLLGVSGLALFILGAYILFPAGTPGFSVSPIILGSLALLGGLLLGIVLWAIIRSRSHGPVLGAEAIRKREGRVDGWNDDQGSGHVIVEGERWAARSDQKFSKGDRVKVTAVEGLVLRVVPVKG